MSTQSLMVRLGRQEIQRNYQNMLTTKLLRSTLRSLQHRNQRSTSTSTSTSTTLHPFGPSSLVYTHFPRLISPVKQIKHTPHTVHQALADIYCPRTVHVACASSKLRAAHPKTEPTRHNRTTLPLRTLISLISKHRRTLARVRVMLMTLNAHSLCVSVSSHSRTP